MKSKDLVPVMVEWIDAKGADGWKHTDDLPEPQPSKVVSLGWLVEESDTAIMVSCSFGDSCCGLFDGYMVIPWEAVTAYYKLDIT